jgi:hypothetical protein
LRVGEVWACAVRPPVPYTVRFTITIEDVAVERHITAVIDGDIAGRAQLLIEADGPGCRVRLLSALIPERPALKALTFVGRPLARYGHNWVLDTAGQQFENSDLE